MVWDAGNNRGDNSGLQLIVPRIDNNQAWVMLSASDAGTCGILSDGTVKCWVRF
jgi:hypothetical protein